MEQGFDRDHGYIEGCQKDGKSITADWLPLQDPISGVTVREVKNVLKHNGVLTEILRSEWLEGGAVGQVFQVELEPGAVSAWHAHRFATDRLFASRGRLRLVLYDGRAGSATFGRIHEVRFGSERPALVVVPPGVWHGVHNLSAERGCVLNLPDRAYVYEDPDHWRLPESTDKIPYRFGSA